VIRNPRVGAGRGGAARGRRLVWLALAVPGFWIAARWFLTPDAYGYGHAIADSGDWAAWLLLAALAVTPLRRWFGTAPWTAWLARHRRALGVASFAYAALHTAIYLADRTSLTQIIAEAGAPELLTGWLALLLFAPLAATSNDRAVRALKRSWKRLHRLVHPAAVLVFAHWALTAFDPATAFWHIGLLAALELARIWPRQRQSVT
jgi:methionine sulfoxide reductase heme-binding subunit